MAQGVGTDGLGDARLQGLTLYHDENHGAGELTATAVEEDEVAAAWLYLHQVSVDEPILQFLYSPLGDWHESLLRAFANHAYELLVEIES